LIYQEGKKIILRILTRDQKIKYGFPFLKILKILLFKAFSVKIHLKSY